MVSSCVGQTDVDLLAATEPAEAAAEIDFTLVPRSLGGIGDGIWGLSVWVEGTNAVAEQDSVIVISGNTTGGGSDMFTSMMPMLMMVMMLGMMAPMMQSFSEGSDDTEGAEASESLS
jgi:hypothetical protein